MPLLRTQSQLCHSRQQAQLSGDWTRELIVLYSGKHPYQRWVEMWNRIQHMDTQENSLFWLYYLPKCKYHNCVNSPSSAGMGPVNSFGPTYNDRNEYICANQNKKTTLCSDDTTYPNSALTIASTGLALLGLGLPIDFPLQIEKIHKSRQFEIWYQKGPHWNQTGPSELTQQQIFYRRQLGWQGTCQLIPPCNWNNSNPIRVQAWHQR